MFLNEIIANKTIEIEISKQEMPLQYLIKAVDTMPAPLDFVAALDTEGVGIIMEIKKASPSKGIISWDFRPVETARLYRDNGAAAISVLTDGKYFLGSLKHLREIKKAISGNPLPLLRKDFVLDVYQIYESRVHGADCVLLITAILKPDRLQELLITSHSLGMRCLVEVHNEDELKTALECDAKIIGINNRYLNSFTVDMSTTERLRPLIPPDRIVVSESGIKSREDMLKLKKWGVNAALIGEALMSSDNIKQKIRELSL
jgi:indole-3-glycerol phosphate synthase